MARRKKDEQTPELPFEELKKAQNPVANVASEGEIIEMMREGFLTKSDIGVELSEDNPGFLPRGLVLANLPYKRLVRQDGSVETNYIQKNSEVTLEMLNSSLTGLPFGKMARMILAYISEFSIKKKTRIISLESSASAFFRKLGMFPTTTIKSLKETLRSLAATSLHFTFTKKFDNGTFQEILSYPIFSKVILWNEASEFNSEERLCTHLELSEYYYSQLQNSIPINVNALKKLVSPMAIDIYCFVAYQSYRIKSCRFYSWEKLHSRLGKQFSRKRRFKEVFKINVEEIKNIFLSLS